MSLFVRVTAKQAVVFTAAVTVLALTIVSGVSLISASRTGAQMESDIATTQARMTKHDEALREALARATGIEELSVVEAKRAAMLALRRRSSDGGHLAVARLKQRYAAASNNLSSTRTLANAIPAELAKSVTNAAADYTAKASTYQAELTQARDTYALELDSGWRGMWLRMVGYPKIDLRPAKPRLALPPIVATPAPTTVTPAATSSPPVP